MSVALVMQHAKRMRRIIFSSVACLIVRYFLPLSKKTPHFIYFFQQIQVLNILNMLHSLCFFPLQNAIYLIMLPFFVSCIIHILHTGCAKI